MKEKLVQVRVTNEEDQRIKENCEKAGMNKSEYLRSRIFGGEVPPIDEVMSIDKKRGIMNEAFDMFSVLNQMADMPETIKLREGVNKICQFLK